MFRSVQAARGGSTGPILPDRAGSGRQGSPVVSAGRAAGTATGREPSQVPAPFPVAPG